MTCENSAIKQEKFVIMTVEQILNGDMLYINNEKKRRETYFKCERVENRVWHIGLFHFKSKNLWLHYI